MLGQSTFWGPLGSRLHWEGETVCRFHCGLFGKFPCVGAEVLAWEYQLPSVVASGCFVLRQESASVCWIVVLAGVSVAARDASVSLRCLGVPLHSKGGFLWMSSRKLTFVPRFLFPLVVVGGNIVVSPIHWGPQISEALE